MEYCGLHRVEYNNCADECPLCARESSKAVSANQERTNRV